MALRIDPTLGRRAPELRNGQTHFEQGLWLHLRNSQLEDFKFRRQTVIKPYICDFFCPAKGLIVEVDGDTHDAEMDAKRDRRLGEKGFVVLRFTNADVGKDIEGVLQAILLRLRALSDRFTHPLAPSLEREGQ
jgi:very-short-patch-repair endonuclease